MGQGQVTSFPPAAVAWAVYAKAYGATGNGVTDDTVAIQAAFNSIPNGGTVALSAGTFKISQTLTLTANQRLVGVGVGATILTTSADINVLRMGNCQVDHIQRNWMYAADFQIAQTNGASTKACLIVDGGGEHTVIKRVSTGGGKYGFELMDLDRCYFEDLSANNPLTAGFFLEVGFENTYGTVTFTNCDTVLSNNNTYGWYVAANAGQGAPNAPDRLTWIGGLNFMSTGLVGCVGFYNVLPMTSVTFIGTIWEQNNRQYRSDGAGSSVNFLGCTFLDANNAATDIIYMNAGGTFTFRNCRFQQATNCFNAVAGSPSISLEGKNNNQGNLTNMFVGVFGSKMGTDTVFAGDGVLASGLNNQRLGYVFANNLVGNPVKVAPSADSTTGIQFQNAAQTITQVAVDTTHGGLTLGNGAALSVGSLYSGSGAPNIPGATAGSFYFRTDTPGTANQRVYVATAINTWTGIL